MTETEIEMIYEEGYDAYVYELNDIDSCPYSGRLSMVWMAGWLDAEQDDYDYSL
jgi:ribosome modulation factor